MFVYITFSLGQINKCQVSMFMIESKITLGLGGVMIVLLSVAASIGTFGFIGVPATLIIFEIIPFLVLAVGVDNIFILVQTYQREPRKDYESHAEHVGRVVGEVAPSMLLSSVRPLPPHVVGRRSGAVPLSGWLPLASIPPPLTSTSQRRENASARRRADRRSRNETGICGCGQVRGSLAALIRKPDTSTAVMRPTTIYVLCATYT